MPIVDWSSDVCSSDLGGLAAHNNTLFIAPDRRGAPSSQFDALRAALAGHQPVALFPEGTTSDGAGVLPFKPSLLAVLLPPPRSVRIQPVHIDSGPATAELSWHSDEPAGAKVKRLLERQGRLALGLGFRDPCGPTMRPA